MGRYLNRDACLDCGSYLGGLEVCRQCGLPQLGPDADDLRGALAAADQVLMRMQQARAQPAPMFVAASAQSEAPEASDAGAVSYSPAGPAAEARPSRIPAMSGSAVLLGLGALCFVVAVVVFVSVTWSDLSLAARAAILLGVTALVGAVAWLSVRKELRGSAETFAVLFTILVVVDFVSAKLGDLAGMGGLSWQATEWITGLLLVAAGGAWAVIGVHSRLGSLAGAQIMSVIGLASLAAVAFQYWPYPSQYVALICVAAAVLAGEVARRLRLPTEAAGAFLLAGICLVLAVSMSLERLVTADTLRALWRENGAYGWLICCAIFAAAATIGLLPPVARIAAASAAVAGVTALVVQPMWDANPSLAICAFAAATACLAGLWLAVPGIWGQGARLAALLPAVAAVSLLAPSVGLVIVKCISRSPAPWTLPAAAYPRTLGLNAEVSPLVAGLVAAVLAVVGWLLVLRRAPSPASSVLIAAAAAAVGALNYRIPLLAVVGVFLLLALLGVGASRLRGSGLGQLVFVAAVPLALLAAVSSVSLTLIASAVLCLVFGALAALSSRRFDSSGFALVAVALLGLAAAAATRLLGGDFAACGLSVVAVGALAALLAQTRLRGRGLPSRVGIELGGVVATAVGLLLLGRDLLEATDSLSMQIALTLAGVAAVVVSLVSADRRRASLPGGLLLAAATWVRLVDAGVEVIEAYTLPSALVLLIVGAWNLEKRPELGSVRALLPGLSLGLLPSLLACLDSPTSLRALLLGCGSLAVLLVGAQLRLVAPLAAGSVVVAALAVLNVAPLALGLPRWILFASAGAALLFLGMTWEKRLADLRTFGQAVERLG